MGVCRYFLQGTCRFGDNCRFEHPLPSYSSNINLVHQQQQPQLSRQQPQGLLNSNDFFDLVKLELESAERSGQWSLSCYCPCPSKSALLPGLDDYSPEEIRCLVYQAQASGNVQPCFQHIQNLYQDAQAKRNIFKSQSPECKALLERVRSGPASPSSPAAAANPFLSGDSGNTSGHSIFGGSSSVPTAGIFGGSAAPQATSSVFGGGASVAANPNPFGSANPQPPSIFGGGSSPTGGSPFMSGGGNTQPPPYSASSFGASAFGTSPAAVPQGSIFGGGAPSIFGGQGSSVFQGAPPGGPSPAINAFSFAAAAQSSQQLQGLVGPAPAAAPVLVQKPFVADPPPPTTASNPFGPTSAAVSQAVPDSGTHLALNELTEEEKAEFMAPTFSKGRIPLRPPPAQLCT